MSKTDKLTKNQMQYISEVAATEAIKAFEKKQRRTKKEERDWQLRNTELLLKNYRKLKDHCREIEDDIDEYENEMLNLKELSLESLEKYRFKTAKMLKYVEKKLLSYEIDCSKGPVEEQRRYDVLYNRYLADTRLSAKEIADFKNIEQRTVYRDTKQAINDFSVYLFGIDAIEFK